MSMIDKLEKYSNVVPFLGDAEAVLSMDYPISDEASDLVTDSSANLVEEIQKVSIEKLGRKLDKLFMITVLSTQFKDEHYRVRFASDHAFEVYEVDGQLIGAFFAGCQIERS